jgi:hypothetical protein
MKLCVIGTGYIGLVGAAVFADWGNTVIGVDKVTEKIEKIKAGELVDVALSAFQIPLEKIADIKSQLFNLPRWVGKEPTKELLAKISEESTKHYKMIFLEEAEDHLSMGILDPEINGLKEAVSFLSKVAGNKPYKLFILSLSQYDEYLSIYSGKKITKINSAEISDSIDVNKNVEIKFSGGGEQTGDNSLTMTKSPSILYLNFI